jgi:SAM-dependent methyltransferase
LKELGHRIIGIDASPSMVAAARESDPAMDVRIGDAVSLPLEDASTDLAVAFMSLHDFDALGPAVREIARILVPGGRLCFAIVHPINSAGRFDRRAGDAPFVIQGDYLHPFRYSDTVQRDGLTITLHDEHRPIETYFGALARRSWTPCRGATRDGNTGGSAYR